MNLYFKEAVFMDLQEQFAYLETHDHENSNAYLHLFLEDSINEGILIHEFYPFFRRIFKIEGSNHLAQVFKIASNYLELIPEYENKYLLLYLKMNYYYSIGDYVFALALIDQLSNLDIPGNFKLSIHIMKLIIFQYQKRNLELDQLLNFIENSDFFTQANIYIRGIYYINATWISVIRNDIEQASDYLNKMNRSLNNKNISANFKIYFTTTIKCFVNILSIQNEAVEQNINKIATCFYKFVMNSFAFTNASNEDSDNFIFVLKKLANVYTVKMEYDICEKIILDMKHPLLRNLINYYNYLYQTNNPYYMKNEHMRSKHVQALYDFYIDNQKSYAYALEETLKLQTLEEKLNQLESKYSYDLLTNCFNRNYLVELENEEIQNACVIYLDLDNLKQVNDAHGHNSGDVYLKVFGNILLKCFNKTGTKVFRYGGDEFVVLIEGGDEDFYIQQIQRLIASAQTASLSNSNTISIGFSCGMAIIQNKSKIKDAIILADEAMYECKAARRDHKDVYYVIKRQE